MSEEMVTIPLRAYNAMKEKCAKLSALEQAGVDNWSGYDYAREIWKKKYPEEEEDEKFCGHCNKETLHKLVYSEHERDSSNDYFECKVCSWWGTGMSVKYNPPIESE